jgi:hypothetical protein
MKYDWFEVGTIGSTPLYEYSKARCRNLGKLMTEQDLKKAIKDEREACALECDELFVKWGDYMQLPITKLCAEAIRGRG